MSLALSKLKKRPVADTVLKPKKKIDRFDGLSEEEVQRYTLDDILEPDLDLVFVGINPSLMAAHRGRYYAGPGNHFYKLLHASGLVPRFVSFEEDKKLLLYKIGLTNVVARATRSSADLDRAEIKEGARIVRQKLQVFKPKVAVFNGKCIYEAFADKAAKTDFCFGLQPERVGSTVLWVVPSSSARCAHFPKMEDKLHFYSALKKYLGYLKGEETGRTLDESEFRFEGKCKQSVATTSKMWRRRNVSAFLHGGRVANKDTVCLDTSDENIQVVRATEFVVTEILGGRDDSVNSKVQNSKSKPRKEQGNDCRLADSGEVSSPMREGGSKRSCRRESPLRTGLSRRNDSTDFMDLIKKRLSEKRDRSEGEEKMSKPCTKSIGEGKKLKYANLKIRSGERMLRGARDASKIEGEDREDSMSD